MTRQSDGKRKFEIGNSKVGVEVRQGRGAGRMRPWKAIDGEIAAVYGEDLADAFEFRDAKERGIREVHGTVSVFTHQLPNPRAFCGVRDLLFGFRGGLIVDDNRALLLLHSVLVLRGSGAQVIIFLFSRISLNSQKMRSFRRAFGHFSRFCTRLGTFLWLWDGKFSLPRSH